MLYHASNAVAETSSSERALRAEFTAPALPSHIPSLDGMRAVCILLVCIAHGINAVRYPAAYDLLGHLGNYGVRIFFLISGFLITQLLLKEYCRFGRISLQGFYTRRAIRIFPAFYVYVAVIGILMAVGYIRLPTADILHAVTYTMNYYGDRQWYLNHTWSLSVEEQFYLLWPAVVAFSRPAKALRVAAAAMCVVPVIRAVMYYGFGAGPAEIGRHFEAVCDALATGCVLAGCYNQLGASSLYRRMQTRTGYIILPVALLCLSGLTYMIDHGLYYILGQTMANVGGALLLDFVVRYPGSLLGTILNRQPLIAIGRWSYSIYLWQELFLSSGGSRVNFGLELNVICLAACSITSYYCVERPFMKLRQRSAG